MEAAGLAIGAVGLTALISSCKHLMDRIESFRHVGSEARPILADFSASKILFDRWLQSVNTNGDFVQAGFGKPVDDKTARVLQDLLSCLKESLESIEVFVSDFSTLPTEVAQSAHQASLKRGSTSFSTKTRFQWAFSKKEKAIREVQDFYRLVQKLHALVPVSEPGGDAQHKPSSALDVVDELAARMNKISEQNKAETRRSIDTWLGSNSTESYYEDCLRERQDATCSWIFDRPAFASWISPEFPDNSAKILWLHAPAGFGKTVMCARIVESLKSTAPDTTALYFFHEHQSEPYAILRSWISQIVYQHDEALQTVINHPRISMTPKATHSDLEVLFSSILKSNPGFTFVVDGLDECEDANANPSDSTENNGHRFLKTLRRLISDVMARIIIVSRDYFGIRSAIYPEKPKDTVMVFEVPISKEDVEGDLKAFSKAVMDKKLSNRPEELRTELADQMAQRANGMFLWVKLHQGGLRRSKTQKQLREIISHMPEGLNHTYDKNMEGINNLEDYDKRRAFLVLRWVIAKPSPPSVGEIAIAFAVQRGGQSLDFQYDELPEMIDQDYINEEIINTCAGLVEVKAVRPGQSHQYRKLFLVHSSIREYLLRAALKDSFQFSKEFSQDGQICETYLRFLNYGAAWERPSPPMTGVNLLPFLAEAVRKWMSHFPIDRNISKRLSPLVHKFFSPGNPNWNRWRDMYEVDEMERGMLWMNDPIWKTWIEYSALVHDSPLEELLFEYLNRPDGSHLVEIRQKSAQIWQDMMGSRPELTDILKKLEPLLESPEFFEIYRNHPLYTRVDNTRGMGTDSSSKNGLSSRLPQPGTRLYYAAAFNHVDVLRNILEAEPGIIDTVGGLHGSALQVACAFGFQGIAEELITRGADVNMQSGRFGCAMNAAAAYGHRKLIQKLFDAGAKMDIHDFGGRDALLHALSRSHEHAAIDLLNLGAPKNVRYELETLKGVEKLTALTYSVVNSQTKVFTWLVETGADICAVDFYRRNCLHHAASKEAAECVDVILNRAESGLLHVPDIGGRDPISVAISSGHPKIVHQLLSAGVKADTPDGRGLTPLHLAVLSNQRDIVQILLEFELDIDSQTCIGTTPLRLAVALGYNDLARDLLDGGADVESAGFNKISLLHTAAETNNAEMVQIFLARARSLLETKDSNLRTPLFYVVDNRHCQIARLLLERGADVNTSNSGGETPLHWAARSANTEMIEILLSYGAEISAEDNTGSTPILDAANCGQVGNYKTLLQHGADERKTRNSGNSVIHLAAWSGSIEMVQFLIDRGWDVNVTNKSMETSFPFAIFSGKSEVLAFLLDHGADTTRPDNRGRSYAHWAALKGQTDYLRILFDRDLVGGMEWRDHDGYTPLHKAAFFGHVDVIELILGRVSGIIDERAENGRTPLVLASANGHALVMETLIEKGADTTVLPPGCKPLLQIAQDGGHIEAVKVLLKELHKQISVSGPHLNSSGDHRPSRSRSLPPSVQREVSTKERAKRSLSR